jgi:hypothetical protein
MQALSPENFIFQDRKKMTEEEQGGGFNLILLAPIVVGVCLLLIVMGVAQSISEEEKQFELEKMKMIEDDQDQDDDNEGHRCEISDTIQRAEERSHSSHSPASSLDLSTILSDQQTSTRSSHKQKQQGLDDDDDGLGEERDYQSDYIIDTWYDESSFAGELSSWALSDESNRSLSEYQPIGI